MWRLEKWLVELFFPFSDLFTIFRKLSVWNNLSSERDRRVSQDHIRSIRQEKRSAHCEEKDVEKNQKDRKSKHEKKSEKPSENSCKNREPSDPEAQIWEKIQVVALDRGLNLFGWNPLIEVKSLGVNLRLCLFREWKWDLLSAFFWECFCTSEHGVK